MPDMGGMTADMGGCATTGREDWGRTEGGGERQAAQRQEGRDLARRSWGAVQAFGLASACPGHIIDGLSWKSFDADRWAARNLGRERGSLSGVVEVVRVAVLGRE